MCRVSVHSIINSGLIAGGQNLSKRQTVFFTSVDPMNKEHKEPDVIDLDAPRLAWYKQRVWKKHQDTVYLDRYQTCSKNKGMKHDRTQPSFTTRSQLFDPKALMMETAEIIYEKVYASLRLFPKT